MGFFNTLRKWFTDITGFSVPKESIKRKLDKCEPISNKRARMDDGLVEVVEISDESLSEAEEVEITEPGPSTMPLRASPPVMLIEGRHHQRRTLSPSETVDLTEISDDENEVKFVKAYSLSNPHLGSNRTSSTVRNASSKSCSFDTMKLEDKYSYNSSIKGTKKSSMSMEGGFSALNISGNSSTNKKIDNSFAMILKNYVSPKIYDTKTGKPNLKVKTPIITRVASLSNNEEYVLNQSNLTSDKKNSDAKKFPTITRVVSLHDKNEYFLNRSNSSGASDKENSIISDLSLNKNRIIQQERFYERILKGFKNKKAIVHSNVRSFTLKSPDDLFNARLETVQKEIEKCYPSKKKDVFPGYSQEIIDEIARKMSRPQNVSIVPQKNIKISDLRTVYSPCAWLNDEVINHYLEMIVDRDPTNIHSFDTFFYTKLCSQGYQSVRRWSRKKDIFSYKKMLAPIHLGNHWCLTCVNFVEKTVTYYDSLGGRNVACLDDIFGYLKGEHLNKKGEELVIDGWRLLTADDCPGQKNGYDCGVFTCINAEYLARDAKLDFTQEDMPILRNRICYEILNNELCY